MVRRTSFARPYLRFLAAALATALIATAGGFSALTSPAHAAKPAPTVTVSAALTAAPTGTVITLRGKLNRSGTSVKVKVQLQTRSGWKNLGTKRLKGAKGYAIKVKLRPGAQRYRVASTKTSKLRNGYSRAITLTGTATTTASPGPAATPELASARATILADTNTYRSRSGLSALTSHASLDAVAQNWATTMAASSKLFHNPSLSSQVPANWRAIAENVAMGQSVGDVSTAWYNSAGHRANMLGSYTHIGIGYVRDARGVPWYVQVFMR